MRAADKARAVRPHITQHGAGHYTVLGSAGTPYAVRRLDPYSRAYACDCPAGAHGLVCYHQAAVALLPYEMAGRAAWRRQRRSERAA
jgi:hypothetical protein